MEKTALRYDAQITQVGVAFIVAGKVPRLERPRQRFARRGEYLHHGHIDHHPGGKAEALEFIIKENSAVAGIPLQDLNFRKNTLICCIYRNGKVILPGGQDMMLAGDSVLVVISGYRISDIKEILED